LDYSRNIDSFSLYSLFPQSVTSINNLSDLELVVRLKNGDEHALRLIYKKYWKILFNNCYRRLHDNELSEEVVQDIFADLWEKKATREIDNLEAYLLSAVKYAVFRQYKRKRFLPFFEEPLEHLVYDENSADTALFLKELQLFVEKWLEAQPEKKREIFRRRYIEEQTTQEISEGMSIAKKTVQNTLRILNIALRANIVKLLLLMSIFANHNK